jgi:hypothetical protein
MSAPVVLSVEPGNAETDVILGTPIFVTFDQEIDATTISDATFCMTGPGTSEVVTAQNMATLNPLAPTGREYITGAFSFVLNSNNQTVLTFIPNRALRKNTTYDVLILGASGSLVSNGVKNPAGEQMVNSYEWQFTTGTIDLTVPPPSSPLPALVMPIDPDSITISTESVGNDLSQVSTITFPDPIDPATDLSQIKCSLQPILNDPTVRVPSGITTSVVIDGNQLKITMSGWPASTPSSHFPFWHFRIGPGLSVLCATKPLARARRGEKREVSQRFHWADWAAPGSAAATSVLGACGLGASSSWEWNFWI